MGAGLAERPLHTRLGWLLRKNLLLILQLLAAILLIAALADPSLLHFGAPAGDLVVVLDLTASMKAKGNGGTRFDAARREFLSLVDALRAQQKMLVMAASTQPRLIAPFTSDKRKLRELGGSIEATDAPGRVKDAILFAHAFLKRASADRVVVISDGAFSGAEEYAKASAHLSFIKIDGVKAGPTIWASSASKCAGSPIGRRQPRSWCTCVTSPRGWSKCRLF